MSEPTQERMQQLHEQYQSSVKEEYKTSFFDFTQWVINCGNFEEKYIEVPSNETLSGNALILDW